MSVTKEYSKGDVTVLWKPDLCIHSEICVKGLPNVFKPKEKPWIQLEETDSEKIINQVNACPSGALSIKNDKDMSKENSKQDRIQINIVEKGPMIVMGDLEVTLADGSTETKTRQAAFCRCGASSNKPYCDGSHNDSDFEG